MLVLACVLLGGKLATAGPSPASVSVYPAANAKGLMVTTGGWAYCLQLQALARREHYTLACGQYWKDGYVGYGLRAKRHLDWGDAAYLADFAHKIAEFHRSVGGQLILIGVSYSGFGVATLASHHPGAQTDAADRDRLLPRSRRPPPRPARDTPDRPRDRRGDRRLRSRAPGPQCRTPGPCPTHPCGHQPDRDLERLHQRAGRVCRSNLQPRCERSHSRRTRPGARPAGHAGSRTASTATTSGIAAAPSSPDTRPDTQSASHPTAASPPARSAPRCREHVPDRDDRSATARQLQG